MPDFLGRKCLGLRGREFRLCCGERAGRVCGFPGILLNAVQKFSFLTHDFVARFGGEEFALVLYGPDHDYARRLPERLRESVVALKIPHQQAATGPYLTVSIGVANVMPDADRSLEGAIQMADEALYQAKEEGRNRTIVRDSPNATVQTGRFRVDRRRSA